MRLRMKDLKSHDKQWAALLSFSKAQIEDYRDARLGDRPF